MLDFSKFTVAVVGDLMLDEYIWGRVERISPEAPVPVVLVEKKSTMLGGAGNVAANIKSLGAKPLLISVTGDDAAGRQLRQIVTPDAILLVDEDMITPVKTRIIAHTQQVARVDTERIKPLLDADIDVLSQKLRREHFDAVIVSDYGKGVISRSFMERIKEIAQANKAIVAVDPVPKHTEFYAGVDVITPNEIEYQAMPYTGQAKTLLITRGPRGMTLVHNRSETHIPTEAKRVFDVSGAGDTVIATFTLGLVHGLHPIDAAKLANKAAGIVVAEVGTAVVTLDQLMGD